jgi:hypothetical protein
MKDQVLSENSLSIYDLFSYCLELYNIKQAKIKFIIKNKDYCFVDQTHTCQIIFHRCHGQGPQDPNEIFYYLAIEKCSEKLDLKKIGYRSLKICQSMTDTTVLGKLK